MAKSASRFYRAEYVVRRFQAAGCEVRPMKSKIRMADGAEVEARFLYNPATGGFVTLVDLTDDDQISEYEIGSWERRLGVTIPKPDTTF